jgi:hypothetical protein
MSPDDTYTLPACYRVKESFDVVVVEEVRRLEARFLRRTPKIECPMIILATDG